LFSYTLLQVKTTGIAAQHDGNPLILPILGRQNPENKNYLENFLKSLKKRLTKQHLSNFFCCVLLAGKGKLVETSFPFPAPLPFQNFG
jgi:hypothetical protein